MQPHACACPTLYVDTERVILEVRQRPVLWDLSHALYKDRDARIQAWNEAFETLYPSFNTMDDKKRKEIEKMVQQRWKTARDAYIRSKNLVKNTASGSGGGKKKMYVYSEEMTFLDKKNQTEAEDTIDSVVPPNEVFITDTLHTIKQEPSFIQETISEPPELNSPPPDNSSAFNFANKRKNIHKRKYTDNFKENLNKKMMQMFKENAKLLKNDDLAFFMSLLPVTAKFSMHQKLIFRSEVLKKAMEIGNMHNPYETNRLDSAHTCCSVHSDSNALGQQSFAEMSDVEVTQNAFTAYYVQPSTSTEDSELVRDAKPILQK